MSVQSHWMQEGIGDAVESKAAVARCLQEHGFSQVDIQEGGADLSAPHKKRTADLEPKTPSRRSRTRRSTHAINAMNAMNAWLMACSTVSGSEGETCRSSRLAMAPWAA